MKAEKQIEVINEIIAPDYKLVLTRKDGRYKNFSIAMVSLSTPNMGETIQSCCTAGNYLQTEPEDDVVKLLIHKIITVVLGIGEDAILRHLKDLKEKEKHLEE